MSLGTLTLKLVECKLTRDVKAVRKMDPYCKMSLREQEWTSPVCESGSKKPHWDNATVDLDIKYLGDDIYYTFYDEDPGRDEKICMGQSKVSTWCAEPEMDLWVDLEWKGKDAGKAHFISKWQVREQEVPKEEHEDEMAKAQKWIKELMAKKAELEAEYAEVQAQIETTAEEVAAIEAEFVMCDCDAKYDEDVAKAHAKNERALARIERNKEAGQEAKADFEATMEKKIAEASEWRDNKLAEYDAADAKADEDKQKKFDRIAQMQENEEEEHAKELEKIAADIEATKAADQEKYDAVAEEIKEVAEGLLEMNEKMQEYLTKMTEL
jgi:hypothetical protein